MIPPAPSRPEPLRAYVQHKLTCEINKGVRNVGTGHWAESTTCTCGLDAALASPQEPLMELDNHHNALKCSYCNPNGYVLVPPSTAGPQAPSGPPQEDLPADAAKVLRDHAWEMYDGTPTQAPSGLVADLRRLCGCGECKIYVPKTQKRATAASTRILNRFLHRGA